MASSSGPSTRCGSGLRCGAIDDIGRDLRSCAQTSTAGLAAYFPFDEGAGATTGDVSGNENVAELGPSPDAGPAWVDSTVPFH